MMYEESLAGINFFRAGRPRDFEAINRALEPDKRSSRNKLETVKDYLSARRRKHRWKLEYAHLKAARATRALNYRVSAG